VIYFLKKNKKKNKKKTKIFSFTDSKRLADQKQEHPCTLTALAEWEGWRATEGLRKQKATKKKSQKWTNLQERSRNALGFLVSKTLLDQQVVTRFREFHI
jgi:hypothetical protein